MKTIMVNCNPETVSTDYDTSDRLYLNPSRSKTCWRSWTRKPVGVIVQFGGQTPPACFGSRSQRRTNHRHQPDMIDAAEDRERFQKLLHDLGLK